MEHGRNPSTDYYVLPRLRALGVPLVAEPQPGSLVVIVRYLDARMKAKIEALRGQLAGLAFFMDDDLFDLRALARPPLRYGARMGWLARRHKAWLKKMRAQLWVSTPYLAGKYRHWDPVLLAPAPEKALLERWQPVRVFYHGTGLHMEEIEWLVPVVREVQARSEHTSFEIFGRAAVEKLYSGVPRTAVIHPMPWENYRAWCAGGVFHVGLAPLLPHAFNAARSHSKFYDFVRCGAAGIYSSTEPYASFVRHGEDGLLVENDPAAWVEAILQLAGDASLRERLAAAARRRAEGGS